MPADPTAPRIFASLPRPQRRFITRKGPQQGLPPFWWFLPSVALGLSFWIVVLALVFG